MAANPRKYRIPFAAAGVLMLGTYFVAMLNGGPDALIRTSAVLSLAWAAAYVFYTVRNRNNRKDNIQD